MKEFTEKDSEEIAKAHNAYFDLLSEKYGMKPDDFADHVGAVTLVKCEKGVGVNRSCSVELATLIIAALTKDLIEAASDKEEAKQRLNDIVESFANSTQS